MQERYASGTWEMECRFWPAGEPEEASYGQLKNSPEQGLLAHLMDSSIASREKVESYEAVHGETLGGMPFTLLHVWVGDRHLLGLGRQGNTVDLRAYALVEGAHVGSEDDVIVQSAGARIQRLLESLTGGKVDIALLNVTPERDSHEEFLVDVDGVAISLNIGTAGTYGRHRQSAELIAGAAFGFDTPINLSEFQDRWLDPLCDLVSFATSAPSFLESLRVETVSSTEADPHAGLESEVRIIRQRGHRRRDRADAAYALVLNLATVPDPEAVVRAWFGLRAKLGPVWPFYFSTLQFRELPLENQLLNLTAFAEGYHRTLHDEPPLSEAEAKEARKRVRQAFPEKRLRAVYLAPLAHANSQTQRQRISWLAERALATLSAWGLDAKRFSAELIDTRNWLVHLGDKGQWVCENEAQAWLKVKLEIILAVNLLLDLGLDEDEAAQQIASGMRRRIFPS